MRWYVADKEYVSYLHKFDSRVEKIDYTNRIKPYLGIILRCSGIAYYVPVSSPKDKHINMKNSKDFMKITDPDSGMLLGVLNINNMIPIPDACVVKLKYEYVARYRTFENEKERGLYIDLLRKELRIIKSMSPKILENANWLYNHYKEFPFDKTSARCCNFQLLEKKCTQYQSQQAHNDELDEEWEL